MRLLFIDAVWIGAGTEACCMVVARPAAASETSIVDALVEPVVVAAAAETE